ncbi:MAG: hypothetical protein KAS87_01465 [Candidatus Omnitrophica bacterium]|nr:hypothetical protein [Candidatus Omnitrophota bacterium]
MSNGDVATEKSGKMSAINKKINYLTDACKKNLNLSSEIRAKLLCTDPKEIADAEKQPRESGQLNNIRDSLQDLLNLINAATNHLAAVNKEI